MVHTAMTEPRISWSLRFLMLIRCTRELMRGKLLAKLLNRFWSFLNDLRWPLRDFWVSIAMLIWSFIKLCELKLHLNQTCNQASGHEDNSLWNMLAFFDEHIPATDGTSTGAIHQPRASQQLLPLDLYCVILCYFVELGTVRVKDVSVPS